MLVWEEKSEFPKSLWFIIWKLLNQSCTNVHDVLSVSAVTFNFVLMVNSCLSVQQVNSKCFPLNLLVSYRGVCERNSFGFFAVWLCAKSSLLVSCIKFLSFSQLWGELDDEAESNFLHVEDGSEDSDLAGRLKAPLWLEAVTVQNWVWMKF